MAAPDLQRIRIIEALFLECSIHQQQEVFRVKPGHVHEFSIEYELQTMFSPEEKVVMIELLVKCAPAGKQKKLPIRGQFCTRLTFHVDNFEELSDPLDEEPFHTPNELLLLTLISICFSTSRGMILTKTAGTVLEGFMLPLVDARQLIQYASA